MHFARIDEGNQNSLQLVVGRLLEEAGYSTIERVGCTVVEKVHYERVARAGRRTIVEDMAGNRHSCCSCLGFRSEVRQVYSPIESAEVVE